MTTVIETPRGFIRTDKNGVARLHWNKNFVPKWQGRYNASQVYLDGAVLRFSEPYMPKRSGALIRSGRLFTEIGSGLIKWGTVYANYLYFGKVMVGRKPKVATAKDLKFKGAPKRGAFWFIRMMEVHGKRIIAKAARIAGGTAKGGE